MISQEVSKLAKDYGLQIYVGRRGKGALAQILTTKGDPVGWTANKSELARQSLLAIIQQKELKKLSREEAIAQGQEAKTFF